MMKNRFICLFLSLLIVPQALYAAFMTLPLTAYAQSTDSSSAGGDQTTATTDNGVDDYGYPIQYDAVQASDEDDSSAVDESSLTEADFSDIGTIASEIAWLSDDSTNIQAAPQDVKRLADKQVDVRVTNYLLNMTLPEELGGAGLQDIKIQRLFKNYTSKGFGRYDREAVAGEEDGRFVSTHNRGQAVDISEVGSITCKLVEKRHVGGNTTHFQQPKSIKVAWQSQDGIARNPTPRGPSLMEVSENMSAESILRMLNNTAEMTSVADFVKSPDLSSMVLYLGANMLLKDLGVDKIKADPLSGDILSGLATNLLLKSIPNLPVGISAGENSQDIRVVVFKAQLEEQLNLPAGSLRGIGPDEILVSTGKRVMENNLGLPALYFESNKIADALGNDAVKGELGYLNKSDSAMNVIDGTVTTFQAKDDQAFSMAGVRTWGEALKLGDSQKQALEASVRQKKPVVIDTTGMAVDKNVPDDVLSGMLSSDKNKENETRNKIKDLGQKYLNQALDKASPNSFAAISKALLEDLRTKDQNYGDLKTSVSLNAFANGMDLDAGDGEKLVQTGRYDSVKQKAADYLNEEFDLHGGSLLGKDGIDQLFSGKPNNVLGKIGGVEMDKSLDLNPGSGFQLVGRQKTTDQILGEMFSNRFGEILGLDPNSGVSFGGDMPRNYGDAIVEQRLGMDKGVLAGKTSADNFSKEDLSRYFGTDSNRSLAELRADEDYWNDPDNLSSLEYTEDRLGLPRGSVTEYLKGNINTDSLSRRSASGNISNIAIDKIWNTFDLSDRFRLDDDGAKLVINTIRDWGNTSFEQRGRVINLVKQISGLTLDQNTGFNKGTFIAAAASGNWDAAIKVMLKQGVRQFAGALGMNISGFSDDDLDNLTSEFVAVFNGGSNPIIEDALANTITKATGIPAEYAGDAKSFIHGDFRTGFEYWSIAMWTKFANTYLPTSSAISYADFRNAVDLNNPTLIEGRVDELIAERKITNLTEGQNDALHKEARDQLMQEFRDRAMYSVSDAFLLKAGIPIPPDFTRIMVSGTDKERGELLENSLFGYLDQLISKNNTLYKIGTLYQIYTGEIAAGAQTDQIIADLLSSSGVDFGSLDPQFIGSFYSFIKSTDKTAALTDPKYAHMWSYFDNWIENTLGINGLPQGTAQAIYNASQHGWDMNSSITENGNIIVPSVAQLGENFLVSQATAWADNAMGLPKGSTYQLYQAVKAYEAAKTAGNAAQMSAAQAQLYVIAITIALNACAACQQFFASIDKAIQAPPGFTNSLVAGAIAMAFGLGPAGLFAAAAIYAFGIYDVDYLCPIPPPDRFALSDYDPNNDKLVYKWGDYYLDGTKKVKDNPAPGENQFDWDKDLPFADGNDSDLWMAWARYNTGLLLEKTIAYGEETIRPNQPEQVLTLRRANVEYFFPRSVAAFGAIEPNFPEIGMGYTQTTTKTADWVHIAFGGWI